MKRDEIENRRRSLAEESRRRCPGCPVLDHYTVRLVRLDEGMLPLVRAFDGPLITPIFSREGHLLKDGKYSCGGNWAAKTVPYVMFLVAPGKGYQFRQFLRDVLNNSPSNRTQFVFHQRNHPKSGCSGPFIDWCLSLQVPFTRLANAEAHAEFKRINISQYARYFRQRVRHVPPYSVVGVTVLPAFGRATFTDPWCRTVQDWFEVSPTRE